MVRNMKRKFFILSILSLLMAFNVNAKEAKKSKERPAEAYRVKFEEIDKDGKGYITEKVYVKYHDRQWKLLDKMEEEVIVKDDFVANCKKENNCDPKYKEKIFEESLVELEKIVKDLESGNIPLDDAITKFNEAMKIAKVCNDKLNKAEESVNKILNKDGTLEEFNVE